ncbi:MAG TPA: hypothetical protein VLM44_05020, partial [Lutibacter sp.]|nr:hypothetical protein [Lutibacter sp.]
MRLLFIKLLYIISATLTVSCSQYANLETSKSYQNSGFYDNIEFKMKIIQEPSIPNYSVNIKDFGAISGGEILNTEAFEKAIEAVTKKGGGKVIIPAGIWLTGPI